MYDIDNYLNRNVKDQTILIVLDLQIFIWLSK